MYFYIYASSGATFEFLEQSLKPYRAWGIDTRLVTHGDILHKNILAREQNNILGFFLPGNQSGQNYRNDLGPAGFAKIREYTAQGGCFYGLCAGGYLACETIIYRGITSHKETTGNIGLFTGTAAGRVPLPNQEITQPKGWEHAHVTSISFGFDNGVPRQGDVLYWGGARLVTTEEVNVLATFDQVQNADGSPAIAVAAKGYDEGVAVFSGVHPEISGRLLLNSASAQKADHDDGTFRQMLANRLDISEAQRSALFEIMVNQCLNTERGQNFAAYSGLHQAGSAAILTA